MGGGAQSDTDIFNLVVRLLLAKVHDELTTPRGKPYKFQLNLGQTISEDINRIEDLYKDALKARLNQERSVTLREPNKGTQAQLEFAINKVSEFSFTEIVKSSSGADIIGSFFENVMRNGFKQTKGQFFTHHNIIRFIVDFVGVSELTRARLLAGLDVPTMIDPSSGSGAFVIECMKTIYKTAKDIDLTQVSQETEHLVKKVTEGVKVNQWAGSKCVGLEINPDLGLAAQLNMIMHGDGSSAMFCGTDFGDGLAPFDNYPSTSVLLNPKSPPDFYKFPVCENFDFVLTNPPFASSIPDKDFDRYELSLPIITEIGAKKSEDLFSDRWFQLLKPGGRLAAIVPNSFLDSKLDQDGRYWLIKHFWIKAIISLPSSAFYPHTTTKTSIVFAKRKSGNEIRPGKPSVLDLIRENGKFLVAAPTDLGFHRTSKSERITDQNDLIDLVQDSKEMEYVIWD